MGWNTLNTWDDWNVWIELAEWSEWWISSGFGIEILLIAIFVAGGVLLEISHTETGGPNRCIARITRLVARYALLLSQEFVFKCEIVELWTQPVITIWKWSARR